MRSQRATLPLGIDIGTTGVRVALAERSGGGRPKLLAVANRAYDHRPDVAIADAVSELATRERRCVLAVSRADAFLGCTVLPPMNDAERGAAARFEVARRLDYPIAEAAVSIVGAGREQHWVIGAARRSKLAATLKTARSARLRPIAVDDHGFAFQRVYPGSCGVIDVGERTTQVIGYGTVVPFVARFATGGADFTQAIADALGIGFAAAEQRKCSIGFGGAGDAVRDAWVAAVMAAFADARAEGCDGSGTFVLCGNGSRVSGLAEALHRASGCHVEPARLEPDASDTLPPDVLRGAAPDCSLAYGLALWDAP
jgi:Tfp pilus assembly PilM family ATPase